MELEFFTESPQKTEEVGELLARKLDAGGITRAFIAMRGEMGVGKTAFVRGFSRHFDISGVRSPTYAIVNEYRGGGASVFHFDMYRIESEDDLFSIAFDDYVMRDGYCIAEWSENISDFIPEDAIFVTISRDASNPDARSIKIDTGELSI